MLLLVCLWLYAARRFYTVWSTVLNFSAIADRDNGQQPKGERKLAPRKPHAFIHYSVHTAGRFRISPKNLMTTMMKPDMWVIIRQSVTNVFLYPKLLDTY